MEKKRILIVDDDPEIRHTLKKRLEHHGFSCDSAASVEIALEKARTEALDLVLLDLGFPGVDGTAFMKTFTQNPPPHKKIPPILVLSCYSDKEIVNNVLSSGAVGFIAKPYDATELLSTIRLLTQTPVSNGPAPTGSEAPL